VVVRIFCTMKHEYAIPKVISIGRIIWWQTCEETSHNLIECTMMLFFFTFKEKIPKHFNPFSQESPQNFFLLTFAPSYAYTFFAYGSFSASFLSFYNVIS
jgi:hypothetical protein